MNENNISKTQRNSSIELLRIISMVMIVSSHFATHGGFLFDVTTLSIPRFWLNFLQMGGDLGVDVFVLISGYFLIKSNGIRFTFNRILKFWGQVIFYSISIFLIFGLLGVVEWRGITLISACFPITFSTWWFVSTYFVLYVIHPFVNAPKQGVVISSPMCVNLSENRISGGTHERRKNNHMGRADPCLPE